MRLRAGRLRGMIDDARRDESAIVCHATLGLPEGAICRGYFDRHGRDVWTVRLAIGLSLIVEFDLPDK